MYATPLLLRNTFRVSRCIAHRSRAATVAGLSYGPGSPCAFVRQAGFAVMPHAMRAHDLRGMGAGATLATRCHVSGQQRRCFSRTPGDDHEEEEEEGAPSASSGRGRLHARSTLVLLCVPLTSVHLSLPLMWSLARLPS
jgi:hypothetical protein